MSKWLLISCCCLTAFVVFTASRIEYLNAKSGFFLPRAEAGLEKWVIPELDVLLERLDSLILERRQNSADAVAAENGSDSVLVSLGPPYSASEQQTLDNMKNLHASHSNLHWWVGSFGIAQYFVAPIAFIAAIICLVCISGWGSKSTAAVCACLSGASIVLMLTRNYWIG